MRPYLAWILMPFLSLIFQSNAYTQCDVTADAGPDQSKCMIPATFQLAGSVTGNPLSYVWTPSTGLSNPNSLTPTATVSVPTTYTLTATGVDLSNNLITNGNFSAGNTGFSTDYTFNANPTSPFNQLLEGFYTVGTNPAPMHVNWQSCGDHTTGTGNMMMVNGHQTANRDAWCQTVPVTPNTDYVFTAWVASVDPNGPCEIQFNINGAAVGPGNIALNTTCLWVRFFVIWNSGAATSAEVCIEDINTQVFGNDFAIDDIVFAPTCKDTNSVTLTPLILTPIANNDSPVCTGQSVNLTASGGTTYQWSGPGGFTASGANVTIPVVTAANAGTYTVTVSAGVGCSGTATTVVSLNPGITENISETTCITANAGVFTQNLTSYLGCDSTVITTVTLNTLPPTNITMTSCDAGALGVFTDTYTSVSGCDSTVITTVTYQGLPITNVASSTCDPALAGTNTAFLTSYQGCDSTVVTTVSLDPTDVEQIPETTCDPAQTGVFVQDLSNQYGCDSTVITTVTLAPSYYDTIPETTCNPQNVGIFFQNFTSFYGCDSSIIRIVTLVPTSTVAVPLTTCDPSQVGVTYQNLFNQYGCDSIVTITTTLADTYADTLGLSTCDPAQAGVFVQNLTTYLGCDSTVTTLVQLDSTIVQNFTSSTCDPAQAGVFTQNLTSSFGCDSTVITTITLDSSVVVAIPSSTCDASMAGVFTQNLITVNGCDSTVITTVTLSPSHFFNIPLSTCDPSQAGVFTENLTNQYGCDSTVISTVTLNPSHVLDIPLSTCDPSMAGVFVENLSNQYGCDSTVTTTVTLQDTSFTQIPEQTCDPALAGVFTQNLTNQYGCDSTVVTTVDLVQNILVQIPESTCDSSQTGVFTQNLTSQAGCDSTVITTVTLSPSHFFNIPLSTCDPSQAGVFTENLTNQYGCDSTVISTVTLNPSHVLDIPLSTCDPSMAGVFVENLSNQYGCDSTVTTTVSLNPTQDIAIPLSTCDPGMAGVFIENLTNQYGCDSTVTTTVTLLDSNLVHIPEMTCDPTLVGVFTQNLTNQNGCDSTVITTVSLAPPADCGVVLTLDGSTVPCDETLGSLTIYATVGEAPFSYNWSGATMGSGTFTDLNMPEIIPNLPVGIYSITVTSNNGMTATATAAIDQLESPTASASIVSSFNGNAIRCAGNADGAATLVASGGTPPYQVLWSNGATTNDIEQLVAGTYTATATDANGCVDSAAVILIEPEPFEISFSISNLDCFDTQSGAITTLPAGGVPPFEYALNGGAFSQATIFDNLTSGSYTVAAEDANGCQAAEIIVINSPTPIQLELGDDIFLDFGEGTSIEALVNVPFDSLDSVLWTSIDSSDCLHCLEQYVIPVISTTYTVTVNAHNGCSATDALTLFVDQSKSIFVPTIFSPENNDGLNNFFTIFAKQGIVEDIPVLSVYDRWGELVWTGKNLQPNAPQEGWDGRFQGKKLPPAVFVWYAKVQFIDGSMEVYKGDVTLMR